MYGKDGQSLVAVRPVELHDQVKAARAEGGRINQIKTIRGAKHQDLLIIAELVELV
jgi:hypothetical protein